MRDILETMRDRTSVTCLTGQDQTPESG